MSGFSADRQRWGWWRTLYVRAMRVMRPWLRIWRIHVRDLAETDDRLPSCELAVRVATAEDLQRAADDPESDLTQAFLEQAIARGDYCAAAFDGARMVAYTWRTFVCAPFDVKNEHDIWIRVAPPFRYGYKALTQPAYRGRKLQDQIIYATDRVSIAKGRPKGVGAVETHNLSSIRADLGRNNKLIGYVGVVYLGRRAWTFRSRGARQTGLELFRNLDS
ncbi:MAG: hypothetical protein AAF993_03165 [Pseudomonadota bacterium]